jgi:predicted nucleotide-binding protein
MAEFKVFYSWQSDLPNSINRGFIQKALENAAKAIRADDSIMVEPVIDRDTAGVPGSPDIAKTIFNKIEKSQVLVCDVSIINRRSKFRNSPNPNVLIELGYAIKTLGETRILMIMNTAYGVPELLPFDLNKKRVVTYNMPRECKDRARERKTLESKLEAALRSILTLIETQWLEKNTQTLSIGEQARAAVENAQPNQLLLVRKFMDW